MNLSTRNSIRGLFFIGAIGFALWSVRVSEFRNLSGLSLRELSYLFFIPPISTLTILKFVPSIMEKIGKRKGAFYPLSAIFIALLWLSFNPPIPIIILCFMTLGISISIFEVSVNTIASDIERNGEHILASVHGFWSLGFMFGGALSGLLAYYHVSFFEQQVIATPILLILVWFLTKNIVDTPYEAEVEEKTKISLLFYLPIALVPLSALFIEGTIMDWSAIFLEDERHFSRFMVGLTIALFMGGMAIIRLTTDKLRYKFSTEFLLIAGLIISAFSMLIFANSQYFALIILAAFFAGLGVGNTYPLVIVFATENQKSREIPSILALIAGVGFISFLLAPAIMGQIGSYFSLSTAFTLSIIVIVLSFSCLLYAIKR